MEIAWALRSALHVDTLLPQILEKVTALMRADRSTFFVVDHARGELWSKVLQMAGELPREIRLRIGDGLAGWVAQTGHVVNLADAYDDPRFDRTWEIKSGYRTQSLLCVPSYDREQRTPAARSHGGCAASATSSCSSAATPVPASRKRWKAVCPSPSPPTARATARASA